MGTLTMKPEQDGMGYFYGEYIGVDGTRVRVDVLPPRSHPKPYFVMTTDQMHETDWIIYANGDEVARARRRDEIERRLVAALTTGTT
jgi:hypothetical protein